MEEFLHKDTDLFLLLNNLGTPQFDAVMKMVSGFVLWIPLGVIILYLLFKNFNKKEIIFTLLFLGIGITISDQLAGIFKNSILRLRPCHNPLLYGKMRSVDCGGQYGFYSAHASTTFLIATYFFRILRRKARFIFLLFFWALLVSYSRIYLGVHYPFDVVFGGLMGFLLGGFFSELALRVMRKSNLPT